MKHLYIILLLSIFSSELMGQGAVVYDPAQYGNMLKQLVESSKQTAQQEAIYVETAKQTVESKVQTESLSEILSIQKDIQAAMSKYSELIPLNPSDIICMLESMEKLFINSLPKVSFNNFTLQKFSCQQNASKLYTIINPFNLYAKTTSEKTGSIFSNYTNTDNYLTTLSQSREANVQIGELSQKNKVQMSQVYEKMGEDKIQQAKKLALQLTTAPAGEVKIKMRDDMDRFMREGLEYKQKSLDLLVEVGNSSTLYQKAEKEKEQSVKFREGISNIQPLKYGVY